MTDRSLPDNALPVTRARPLSGAMGIAAAFALAVLLSWPMLLTSAPLVYFDTAAYYAAGEQIVGYLAQKLSALLPSDGPASGSAASEASAVAAPGGSTLRSIAYSVYVYLTASTPLGLVLTVWLQTTMVLWCVLALLPDQTRWWSREGALAAIGLGALTSLPWFASYAMPDILAAVIVVAYAIALRRIDDLRPGAVIALLVLATFAVAAHYGHYPVAAGLAGLVLVWRIVTRRMSGTIVAFCLLPILVPAAFNYAASRAALDDGSVVPKHLPILLARSLEDGPAAWYLAAACPEAGYAMCEVFDEMPGNITAFLWATDGLKSATPDQFDRIRAEENAILLAAFRAYPLAQTKALLGNVGRQLVSIGTAQLLPKDATDAHGRLRERLAEASRALAVFDRVTPLVTAISALWLALLILRRRVRLPMGEVLCLVVAALLLNAAVFGGLSAPVDRYQSRLAWLLPLVLAMILVDRRNSAV